jgi:hypothetical protein
MPHWEQLLASQNPDGGWGYRRGPSWVEPTCYALMALNAVGHAESSVARKAAAWIGKRQRSDGGFAPRESVDESVWLTVLPLLLSPEIATSFDADKAVRWVLAQSGRESDWVFRLRQWMLGVGNSDPSVEGWPWFPGAAAWVAPTALTILALQKKVAGVGNGSSSSYDVGAIRQRIARGRAYLMARRCHDGGWNHGSTKALGYDSDSYPEATGLALLALEGTTGPEIEAGVRRAEQHLSMTRSLEAASWLTLGITAQGYSVQMPNLSGRGGTIELALATLADAAMQGKNVFLS